MLSFVDIRRTLIPVRRNAETHWSRALPADLALFRELTNRWSGDDGPYHLLLTPTQHQQHGYNVSIITVIASTMAAYVQVWLPSLPNGTSSYNLTIRQPAGLQFVLTMWGASGISNAGTTDILSACSALNRRSKGIG